LEFMGISDRILGKKNVNGKPHIESVAPAAALPGGEIRINGSGLRPSELKRPRVQFGQIDGAVVISSDAFVVAKVPEGATSGPVVVATNGAVSNAETVKVAVPIADNLHPVTNPAIDSEGNIYVTFSGSRGQQVPVSLFKIDTNYVMKPFLSNMMNATSIAKGKCTFRLATMARCIAWPRTAPCRRTRKGWASRLALRLTASRICTSATAAERSSKLPATGRPSCLRHSSQAFRLITWLSVRAAICL
jgi:hypothetical protein